MTLKSSVKTSEFWILIGAVVLLVGDAIVGAFTGSSLFAEYPQVAAFIEKAALTWAAFRTLLKTALTIFPLKVQNTVETTQVVG